MPQTIVVPTQSQLAQWHNSPTSLLAMYQAAQGARNTPLGNNPATTPATSPGANPGSTNLITPVAQQPAPWTMPGYDPSVFKITAPDMPAWKDVSAPAIPQNNMDWVRATTEMINQINQQAQQSANAGRIPGGAGLESKSSANISNALSGQLPADVVYQLGQRAAERGVGSGSPWGANTNADYLKAIGLNSLQLQNTGQDWLSAALARNPGAPIYDPGKLIITPAQQAQFALEGANINLANQRGSFEASNANAARQLKASLANASNQTERDRLMLQYQQDQTARENANAQRQLQSDLENARTQFERDRLVAEYQQRALDRENALRIASMRGTGYGGGSGGGYGSGGGGFNPAGNYAPTSTATPTPFTQPWHLPSNITNYPANTGQGGLDTVQPGMDFGGGFDMPGQNYDPFAGTGGIYPQGGAINPEGLSPDELDWLYNVGG